MIGDDEGHGRLDGKKKTVPLELKSCRFGFPKNPIDKTEFILGFTEDTDKRIVKKAKADYEKIRKFLLRSTSAPNFENTEEGSLPVNRLNLPRRAMSGYRQKLVASHRSWREK